MSKVWFKGSLLRREAEIKRGTHVLPRRVRSRKSLRTFFKRRGFTTQVREGFAGEME